MPKKLYRYGINMLCNPTVVTLIKIALESKPAAKVSGSDHKAISNKKQNAACLSKLFALPGNMILNNK
ncbi:hypothetical protein HK413_06025 [Mucilaginibacter sp. S1162]|uniref:Uncharacterized protein n=1 Tax=Mucilaginibacter humi TaxID=2732510 RepID=A0ABX1W1S8_9SPHI|nr:hypothetical protein [Mucilaginibacter humi]